MRVPTEFPEKRMIWSGAILGSIAHAVGVCRFPQLAHEQSWDGTNYNVQDSTGSRGTISFADNRILGVFFLDKSERNPFNVQAPYSIDSYFRGMPQSLLRLAHDEALQCTLQELNGLVRPIITAAFWGDEHSERVVAAEPWYKVFRHGARLIRNQLLDRDQSLKAWQTDFTLTDREVDLIHVLFDRVLNAPGKPIQLEPALRALLEQNAPGTEGIEACRISLEEIGITM